MKRLGTLGLIALLVACADDPMTAPDAAPQSCDLGTVCEAATLVAEATCARTERCYPASYVATCAEDAVADYCAGHDCAAPYERFDYLHWCLTAYGDQQCVTVGTPISCALFP